jgi:hypothetical protein
MPEPAVRRRSIRFVPDESRFTATLERWAREPLERASRDEIGPVDSAAAASLVASIAHDECSMASFDDPSAGFSFHVSAAAGRYVINAQAGGPFYLRTTARSAEGRQTVWVAGFEWQFHDRFVLDVAEAEATAAELAGDPDWDLAAGGWEEAGVGPDSRPLSAPG